MRKLAKLGTVLVLTVASEAGAQLAAPLKQPSQPATSSHVSFETLSDTKGTQLNAYLGTLARELQEHLRLVESSNVSQSPSAMPVDLVLTINSQGTLTALRLESVRSTASKAAWQAARDLTYPPLPNGLGGSDLKLRVQVSSL